jgi:hypothetical protein
MGTPSVGIVPVHQLEAAAGQPRRATLDEKAGVEFMDENGGGAGVRLRQRQGPDSKVSSRFLLRYPVAFSHATDHLSRLGKRYLFGQLWLDALATTQNKPVRLNI